MKKQVFKTGLIVLLTVLFISPAISQTDEKQADKRETATKEIKKHYDIKQGFTLGVDNMYGSIDIVNWEKDEISVDIKIEVKAATKEKAEKALKSVEIEIEEAKNHVYFETDYDSDSFAPKTSVEVSYTVNAPTYINADLEQKYGSVFIQELTGLVNCEVKYGSFDAEALLNESKEDLNLLEMAYGSVTIEQATMLVVELKYSEFSVAEIGHLSIDSKYSKVNGGLMNEVFIESKYDKVNFKKMLSAFEIESDYTNVNLGEIAADFKLISAEMTYGNLEGILPSNANFNIEAEVDYGGIHIPEGDYNVHKNGSSKSIEGRIGSPGDAIVEVDIKYGSLNLK